MRWPKERVIAVYAGAVAVAFGLIAVGAIAGVIPRPTIIAVAAAVLAVDVYRGLNEYYDSPYQLMPKMGKNIQLHVATGALLIVGYVIALIAAHIMTNPPVFLR